VKLIALFAILIVLPIAALVAAVSLALDDAPALPAQPRFGMADVALGRSLMDRYDPRHLPSEVTTRIVVTEADLNAILNASVASVPGLRARATVRRAGLVAAATFELPFAANPFGRYLNLRVAIPPSSDGFEVSRLAVGRIELPTGLVKPLLRTVIDFYAGSGKGEPIVDSIRTVAFSDGRAVVSYRPPESLIEDLKTVAAKAARVGDPESVRVYFAEIWDTLETIPGPAPVSLARFIGPVFARAKERSVSGDPVAENRSALLALAIFFGDLRFDQFAGQSLSDEVRQRHPRLHYFRLRGRDDWSRHFTVSIGLAVTGWKRLADVAGEVKEADDARGSSGFSFTDLAADRAGTRLAEEALASRAAATRIQEALAGTVAEDTIFPSVAGLPDSLSAAEFRRRFGNLDSDRYAEMVAEIDRRIDRLPLYR
jgi:hypothetical protein